MRPSVPARVLIISDRERVPTLSRCGTYEFEDLAGAVDAVDLMSANGHGGRLGRRIERFVPGAFAMPPKLDRGEPYDLLFASFHSLPELARLHPLGRILGLARRTVVNIDELWGTELPYHTGDLAMLRRFDHVFTPCAGALELVRAATGRPCDYLAPSIDALRFAPRAPALRRVIDIHLMGRRRADLHRALREAAEKTERFYLFDAGQYNVPIPNYVEHRLRLADLIQRTRFFVVDVANSDKPEKRGNQHEFGPRFVEGAAGGAILIGQAPGTKTFESQFWPGAVHAIEPDSAAIARVLDDLDANPEDANRMRRTNVAQVMRRHDGVYRWEQILRAVGLAPLPALSARKQQLDRLAASIEGEDKSE